MTETNNGVFIEVTELPRPSAEELNNRCHLALLRGDVADARSYGEAAVHADPMLAKAWSNLGCCLSSVGLRPAALVAFRRASQIEPKNVTFRCNLGHELYMMGEFEEARIEFFNAMEFCDSDVGLLHNAGLNFIALEDWKKARIALTVARNTAAADGDMRMAETISFDLAHALLAAGDFTNGFVEFESRWATLAPLPAQSLAVPDWKGEDLAWKSLLVFHEQGFGDTLQFVRFARDLHRRFMPQRIWIAVPRTMVGLIAWSFRGYSSVAVIDDAGPMPPPDYKVDYKVPMMTLGRYLISGGHVGGDPYLYEPLSRQKFALARAQLAVGICWSGGHKGTEIDAQRSMPFNQLLRLAEIEGVSLHSLQVDGAEAAIYQFGANTMVEDLAPRLTDWSETARAIGALDLVVTVDTAVAHLAAAMGKPTMILLRHVGCWRWLGRDMDRSPWYPTARLFHQKRLGEWHDVVTRVMYQIADQRREGGFGA